MILGFDETFIPAIVAGSKIHTIRKGFRWQTGEMAQFYARAQQPDKYEFWAPRPILSIQHIELTSSTLRIDNRLLGDAELAALAQADGFATAAGLLAYFAGQPMPFVGQLLHWTSLRY